VSARINGVCPVTLVFDTGADRTLISPFALSRLGISIEPATRVQIRGVTGTAQGDAIWVESVEVGDAKVGPLLIVVHDSGLKGAEGLLGRDFLGHFNITIDPREQKVTLQPN
jgi:predicted aspartyl protease